jgi:hypothetical protein
VAAAASPRQRTASHSKKENTTVTNAPWFTKKIIRQNFIQFIPASKPSQDIYLNLLTPRHALQLRRALHSLYPARALRRIQLQIRLGIIKPIQGIQHADLESLVVAESRRLAPHGGAAVAAEESLDRLARVGLFLPRLGLAGRDLEALAGDHDVGAVGGAGDFLAVGAVAEGLWEEGLELVGRIATCNVEHNVPWPTARRCS